MADRIIDLDQDINVSQYGWSTVKTEDINLLQAYIKLVEDVLAEIQSTVVDIEHIEVIYSDIQSLYSAIIASSETVTNLMPEIQEFHREVITAMNYVLSATEVSNRYNKETSDNAEYVRTTSAVVDSAYTDILTKYADFNAKYLRILELYEIFSKNLVYRGVWNPNSGSWPDPEGTNSKWDVTLNLGQTSFDYGGFTWHGGDGLTYLLENTTWAQVTSTSGVVSVNGRSGNVVLAPSDIGITVESGSLGAVARIDGPAISQIQDRLDNIVGGVIVSDTAPSNPKEGAAWFDSLSGQTYIWYKNDTSDDGQWIEQEASQVVTEHLGGVPLLSVMWMPSRDTIPAGYVAADGTEFLRSTYPEVWALINKNAVPLTTEAEWQANNQMRGNYSSGNGTTTFRIPDYNGRSPGGIGAMFLRGDGVRSTGIAGTVQLSENKAHSHDRGTMNITGEYESLAWNGAPYTGAFTKTSTNLVFAAPSTGSIWGGVGVNFNASRNWTGSTSSEGGLESRPLNITGVWVIKMYDQLLNPATADVANLQSRVERMDAELQNARGGVVPVGSIDWYGGNVLPAGWLLCDGRTVSRVTYADLFGAIGTTFGAGDGSSTFNLPNLTDEFIRGTGANRTLGSKQDDALQNLTGEVWANQAKYGLTSNNNTSNKGVFSHGSETGAGYLNGSGGGTDNETTNKRSISFDASRVARTADETRPRNIALTPIIKAWNVVLDEGNIRMEDLQEEIDAIRKMVEPVSSVTWAPKRSSLFLGHIPADGQLVSRATYPDLWNAVSSGTVPVVSESVWNSDPSKRGSYTVGDGSTTFRLPDYNGVSAGSYGPAYLGAGGADGSILQDRLQNITGDFGFTYGASWVENDSNPNGPHGAFYGKKLGNLFSSSGLGGSTNYPTVLGFDASRVARTGDTTRPITVSGCWAIRAFGETVNVGQLDASKLAADLIAMGTRVGAVEATLATRKSTCIVNAVGTGSGATHETVDSGLPANVVSNTEYILANPFGADVPVLLKAQIFYNGRWADAGWDGNANNIAYGIIARQRHGVGIIVQTGATGVDAGKAIVGTGSGNSSGVVVPSAPCRVFVRRIDD